MYKVPLRATAKHLSRQTILLQRVLRRREL